MPTGHESTPLGPMRFEPVSCDAGSSGRSGPVDPLLQEIACDESGFDGETLIGGSTTVFAHASVRLDVETAAACIAEVRRRTQTAARELKAGTILRSGHRPILHWLIGPEGPLRPTDAHVHLTDKLLHLTGKMIELLAGRPADSEDDARAVRSDALLLHRAGPQILGRAAWEGVLQSFNTMSRNSRHTSTWHAVATFTHRLDRLRAAAARPDVHDLLDAVRDGIPSTADEVGAITDRTKLINILDPMFPALRCTIAHWGSNGGTVAIVHDEQSSLTEGRIAQIRALSYEGRASGHGVLTDFHRVDSRLDPRIQTADLLAGVARSIASAREDGPGVGSLTDLLRPLVDDQSFWPDDRWLDLDRAIAPAQRRVSTVLP